MYPQVFGKYVLERELSRGGMARVALATLRGAGGFEKRLVVKQIRDELAFDQQFVRRFVEEAKTTVALSHPNIVPVYELGVEQGTYFLAMELVEGVSVSDLLTGGSVLTPEEGAYVGVEVCRALDYAHRRMKVVHRDITPRNVMIDEEGQVKLIDFGIAAPALVAGQEILGSPGHMAPEQLDGGELGPPTDIFAVAVLLTEAWTGKAPFRRATPEECAAALRSAAPRPLLADSTPRLAALDEPIARALSADAAARQQEASELARSLRGFLQNTDVEVVARRLGERVRALRTQEHEAPPESLREPRIATATQNTQTFAANEAALTFTPSTRKLPADEGPAGGAGAGLAAGEGGAAGGPLAVGSALDAGAALPASRSNDAAAAAARVDGPSTRKLPDERTGGASGTDAPSTGSAQSLAPEHVKSPDVHIRDGRRAAATGDTPEEAAGGNLARGAPHPNVAGGKTASARSKKSGLGDSIATRPLSTPIDAIAPAPAAARRGWGIYLLVAAAGVAAIVVYASRQTEAEPVPPPQHPVATASVATVDPTASAAASAALVVPPPPSAVFVASASVTQSAPSANVVAAAKAIVALVGEPGTRVSVDGVARGPCPARVALEPGRHDVRFTFEPTSESRSEAVTVKSGESVTVRAEFTGATPTIRVQR